MLSYLPVSVASIRNLTVKYGQFTAVSEFSVDVEEGCTGLLGPNGAGKTTFLKTLLGFIKPVAGGGTVLGFDFLTQGREIRQRIGLMPEQDCHIPGLSAVQFVAYAGELAGMPADQAIRRAHEVLEYCDLGEARYRNIETYSTGMKQRIKLAQALVHGPKLLLLDEPTNGLDPAGRQDMLNLVQSISHGKGISVIICSHLLPDIERTADRVIVMTRGTLRAQGLIRDLKKIEGHPVDVELREDSPEWLAAVQEKGATYLEMPARSTYRIQVQGLPEDASRLAIQCARATGAQVRGFQVAQKSLEDAFLEAVK